MIAVLASIIPLSRAVLCQDCEAVSDTANGHCVGCGSTALVNLATILNRKEEAHAPAP